MDTIPTNGLYKPLSSEDRAQGVTELMYASSWGDATAVDFLLARGDDVNARAQDGWTALHHACSGGEHQDVMARLIAAGADLNAKTGDGTFALIMSAARGKVEEVYTLLHAGADPNAQDALGRTALIAAEQGGHSDEEREAIVEMLILVGSKRNDPSSG